MSIVDKQAFQNPASEYRVKPMMHGWPKENREALMDAIVAYGFGGVVTNPNWGPDSMPGPENVGDFAVTLKELEKRDLAFWIYDESGYPSGYGAGHTLDGHPEYAAKGFYMHRRIAYEPKHVRFAIDDETDKIVWAAKYPVETPGLHESFVQYDKMTPVPFTETSLECDLAAKEVLFVFCVKPAHEGSQATHNTCSFKPYINIMDPRGIKRFIDLCFEPIVEGIPDAYERAYAVFTDEPSLMVSYPRSYETQPYALAPWVDGLFEQYEAEYGESMLPMLPLLFEGGTNAYPIRVKFYELVGKIIAKAYVAQLREWCEAHGGKFSGHYLGEEWMAGHVKDYGSNLRVMMETSIPGIDVLCCYPDIYNYNTAKHTQMAVRKRGLKGMMVEICPFVNPDVFAQDHLNNMSGIMGLIYLADVRWTQSYYSSNFAAYDPERIRTKGLMSREEAQTFNAYVGRLGYMLDGLHNDCETFVYYGIEDTQAKMVPQHSSSGGPERDADISTMAITRKIYEAGFDFYYADRGDIVGAAEALTAGKATISGHPVKTVLVPALDVMYGETYEALKKLASAGVDVLFLDKLPCFDADGSGGKLSADWSDLGRMKKDGAQPRDGFTPMTSDEVLAYFEGRGDAFTAKADGAILIKGRFLREGREMWFVDNNTRADADVVFDHKTKKTATVYDPTTGGETPIEMGGSYRIPGYRGVFVLFD